MYLSLQRVLHFGFVSLGVLWAAASGPAQDVPTANPQATSAHDPSVPVAQNCADCHVATNEKARQSMCTYFRHGVQVSDLDHDGTLDLAYVFLGNGESRWTLGLDVVAASDAVHAQLGIPAGQGLDVTSIVPGGPGERAGVQLHDLILSVDDKPMTSEEDLHACAAASSEKPIHITLRRGGQELKLVIQPRSNSSNAVNWQVKLQSGLEPGRARPWIGVSYDKPDATLRAQLQLPDHQGLVVQEVIPDSPAARAGLQPYDVLLKAGSKSLAETVDLSNSLQDNAAHPITIELLRRGMPCSISVLPEMKQEDVGQWLQLEPSRSVLLWNLEVVPRRWIVAPVDNRLWRHVNADLTVGAAEASGTVEAQLSQIDSRMEALTDELKTLIHQQAELRQKLTKDSARSTPPEAEPKPDR